MIMMTMMKKKKTTKTSKSYTAPHRKTNLNRFAIFCLHITAAHGNFLP